MLGTFVVWSVSGTVSKSTNRHNRLLRRKQEREKGGLLRPAKTTTQTLTCSLLLAVLPRDRGHDVLSLRDRRWCSSVTPSDGFGSAPMNLTLSPEGAFTVGPGKWRNSRCAPTGFFCEGSLGRRCAVACCYYETIWSVSKDLCIPNWSVFGSTAPGS